MSKFLVFLFLFFVLSSCKKVHYQPDDCYNYNYNDCDTQEPFLAEANFLFTINSPTDKVPFIVFEGNIEDNKPLFYDTARGEKVVSYNLLFGKYSVKAEYKKNGKTYFVVDGGKLEKWNNQVCDSVCWSVSEMELNLKLDVE